MGRRIYIIPKSMKAEEAVEAAKLNKCPEIVHGIPPRLEGVIDEASLPMVFEEPEPLLDSPIRDLAAEIDDHEVRLKKLEKK